MPATVAPHVLVEPREKPKSCLLDHAARANVVLEAHDGHLVQTERLKGPSRHRNRGRGHQALAPEWTRDPVAELGAIVAHGTHRPLDRMQTDTANWLAFVLDRPHHVGAGREILGT